MSFSTLLGGTLVGVACVLLLLFLGAFFVYKSRRAARRRKMQEWERALALRAELRRAMAVQPLLVLDPLHPPPAGSEAVLAPLPTATGQVLLAANDAADSLAEVRQRLGSIFIDEELPHEPYGNDQAGKEASGASQTTATHIPFDFSLVEDQDRMVVHLTWEAVQAPAGLWREPAMRVFRRQSSAARYGTAAYYSSPPPSALVPGAAATTTFSLAQASREPIACTAI